MNLEQLALEHQKTADRSIRNEGRIKKLEEENKALHKLATAVAVMAQQLKTMNSNVSALTHEVDALKQKPAKMWEAVVQKAVLAAVAAIIGFVLAKLGLG